MNLHDWIDELCDTLDLDTEVDEGLVLDLAKVVADNVVRPAAPISAYLLGYAAGLAEAGPDEVEKLAAKAQKLAESWDRPAAAPDPETDVFHQGLLVAHPEYGVGEIVALSGAGMYRSATVRFHHSGEERKFVLSKSPLRPVHSDKA